MKNLKENLQAISKELKTLMSKVEKLGKALDKAAKSAISSKTDQKETNGKSRCKKSPGKEETGTQKGCSQKGSS